MPQVNIEILINNVWSYFYNWWPQDQAVALQQRMEYIHNVPCRVVVF